MLQVKRRKDGALKRRFMFTICFYQDTRHEAPLHWVQKILGIGYLSRRRDGMTELRVNGYEQVARIMELLLPFLKFKKRQAQAMYRAAKLLMRVNRRRLTPRQLAVLAELILVIQAENYVTKKKKTMAELLRMFGLTP